MTDLYDIDLMCPHCFKKFYVEMKIGGTGYATPAKTTKNKPKKRTEYEKYT